MWGKILAAGKKFLGAKATQKGIEAAENSGLLSKIGQIPMLIGCTGMSAITLLLITPFIIFVGSFGTIFLMQGVDPYFASASTGSATGKDYLDWAINIANDDSHGYSQCARTGPDYDCSSLVWYSLVEGAGFSADQLGGYAFATGSMPEILTGAGFKEYAFTSMDELQPGDILLMDGHTEIYAGDGQNVGAHGAEDGGICGETGDQTGGEISVSSFYGGWSTYYRLES